MTRSILSVYALVTALAGMASLSNPAAGQDPVFQDHNFKYYLVERNATSNAMWKQNDDSARDTQILEQDLGAQGANIVAYKIRWFNGKWSGKTFCPPDSPLPNSATLRVLVADYLDPLAPIDQDPLFANDVDSKRTPNGDPRRMWAYFFDHAHKFIVAVPR